MRSHIVLVAALTAASCFAQSEPAKAAPAAEPKFFRLDFVVKELDAGKVINSRGYAMTVSTGRQPGTSAMPGSTERSQIRMGGRLPVPKSLPIGGGVAVSGTEFNFFEVGTNIDAYNAREVDSQLALNVTADVTSVITEPDTHQPVTRQLRWSSPVIVPVRKPTVIFSSDDPTSRRQMQLELTATPIH